MGRFSEVSRPFLRDYPFSSVTPPIEAAQVGWDCRLEWPTGMKMARIGGAGSEALVRTRGDWDALNRTPQCADLSRRRLPDLTLGESLLHRLSRRLKRQ